MIGIEALIGVGSKLIDKLVPDPAQKAEAQLKLAELAQSGELAQLAADTKEQEEVSKRWVADMDSDSWLSKNIRPLTLIAIIVGYFGFAIASIFDYDTKQAYVELLGQWGMLVMSAYYGGRTLEKVMGGKK